MAWVRAQTSTRTMLECLRLLKDLLASQPIDEVLIIERLLKVIFSQHHDDDDGDDDSDGVHTSSKVLMQREREAANERMALD